MASRELSRSRKPQDNLSRVMSPVKFCAKCGLVKCKSEFAPMAGRADGLRPYCRPCKAKESREYRERNPEKAAMATKKWAQRNHEKVLEKQRRYQSGTTYRVMHAVSTRIYLLMKGRKSASTERLVGYTAAELAAHLERQFRAGMTWDNYGEWHVDHIRPLSSFDGPVTDELIRKAWCLSNLRPLWSEENMKKSDKRTHLI